MQNTKLFTVATRSTIVRATAFVPYPAYESAKQIALDHDGQFSIDPKTKFVAIKFADHLTAKAVADRLNADYIKATSSAPVTAPAKKPSASKGKTAPTEELTTVLNGVKYKLVPMTEDKPSSTKKTTKKATTKKSSTSSKTAPRKSKGSAFDFGKIKGKTNSEKNRALHKFLVKMGLDDSRTPEYMSIWNARPWAK
jgi:hypothetical protein